MKKLLLFVCAATLVVGCQDDTSVQTVAGKGAIEVTASASGEVTTKAEGENGITLDTPALEDFSLKITGTDFEKNWTSLSDYDTDSERYVAGWYTVAIECGDATEEGYNKPYFATSQRIQVLDRNRTTQVNLVATVGNAIVEIRTTENFRNYFPSREFKLTTENNTFELSEEPTEYLFIAPQKKAAIDCTCIRQANLATGTTESLTTQYIPTVNAATRYIVTYDLQYTGSVDVTVSLDDTIIDTITVDVELNENA